ncbi:hypothetical protein T4A_3255 [Trichinella pseudospiralis]|uniref:Uncharacterized protein n=1 Tax=Trichinella pseudospiralis TaxID=6337 RepID=A0A0V1EPS4_TRIPS|nr:hypothetical protein T4A_3255 [Trichinella pseudospiralis]
MWRIIANELVAVRHLFLQQLSSPQQQCEYLNSYALSYIMPFKNKMASKLLYENILFRSSSFIIVLVGVSMSVVDILLFKFLHSASGYDIMLLADDIKVMSFVDWQQ